MNQISATLGYAAMLVWGIAVFCAVQQFGGWTGRGSMQIRWGWTAATIISFLLATILTLAAVHG